MTMKVPPDDVFAPVRNAGLDLPGVELATKYDGSPVLKVNGCFMAGMALHHSAERHTLVVRADPDRASACCKMHLRRTASPTTTDRTRSCWCG